MASQIPEEEAEAEEEVEEEAVVEDVGVEVVEADASPQVVDADENLHQADAEADAEADAGAESVDEAEAEVADPEDTESTGDEGEDPQPGGAEFISHDVVGAEGQHDTMDDRLRDATANLQRTVFGVADDEGAEAEGVDYWLHLARLQLESNRLFSAKRTMRRVANELQELAIGVLKLRRSLALLHRLMQDKDVTGSEVEVVLLRLRSATAAAELGDVQTAASHVEILISDLVGDDTTALNPFLFRNFWLGVETRWPAGGDHGVLLVRLVNDGDVPLPPMRLTAPVPVGWDPEPKSVDLPKLPAGGFVHLKFHIHPSHKHRQSSDSSPLSRKLSIMAGYSVRQGDVRCTLRLQNRSMESLRDVLVVPWAPPNYSMPAAPLIEKLSKDEIAHIHIPMTISYASGGDA